MKMISTLNAKRTYDDIGHSNFDKIVKMAEIIIDSTDYDEREYNYKYLDYSSSFNLVDEFFKDLNPEYHYRVSNILHEDIRNDIFNFDIDEEYSKHETFPLNGGICFRIKDVEDGELSDYDEKNAFIPSTGEIILNRNQSIELAFYAVHELGHKLATSNNEMDVERLFYSEIPSITLERLFLKWLENKGYDYSEIEQLRRKRDTATYRNALYILITNEMIHSKDEVNFNDIIDKLMIKHPTIKFDGLDMTLIDKMYGKNTTSLGFKRTLYTCIPYVVGRVMADYYVDDYLHNRLDADIFKLIHLYGDGLLDEINTRYQYLFLNLPFENNNIDKLKELYNSDIIDVNFKEGTDVKK